MNAIVRHVLHGEVTSPSACVRLVGKRTPFGKRVDVMVGAGLSIAEILKSCGFNGKRYYVTISSGSDIYPIEQFNFSKVRVKAGVTITATPSLKDNPLKTVLGLAVAVAALIIAPYAAGLFFATGTFAFAATQALVATGILLAGTLALNALFPTRPKEIEAPTSGAAFNSIQGAQNQANRYGAITTVLGEHRQSPFYAANPYTEIVGDDQYLRLLFNPGYGPLEIDEIKIGETPITSFSDYEIEVNEGYEDDDDITLYPGVVNEVALSLELDADVDGQFQDDVFGPYSTQTTAAETDEISVDYTATQGVQATDQNGNEIAFHIKIQTQYRVFGSGGAWTDIQDSYFYLSVSPSRVGRRWKTPARAQYEVRSRRATSRGSPEYTRDEVVWSALRSFKNTPPVTFPKPLALIALRIKASSQLSGVINTLNCVTRSRVKSYSGSGSVWNDDTVSSNPADLFRHVLQGPSNARAVDDSKIDIENLQEWWLYCQSKGFTFNQIIVQRSSVKDKLDDIAAAGRAVTTFIEGKWGVVWDRPDDPIVQKFTPRNSWNFQGQRSYAQQPHGWRTRFINSENGWTDDEMIVYDDGYDSSNATLFEGQEFPGITEPDLIWKHGRFHIAQSRLRPEKFTLSAGWEHLICTKGSRVEIAHDVALIGLGYGRVKSIAGQVVTFDETLTIEDGNNYGMQFRVPATIRSIRRAVDTTPAGEYNELTLVGDLSGVSVGDLFSFGLLNEESSVYRVQNIAHQKDLIATLTFVDDAPEISDADTGTIPPYTPNVTIPADPFTLSPRDFRYSEIIDGAGAAARAMVHLMWQVPRFGNIASFEVQMQDNDNGGPWAPAGSVTPPSTSINVLISRAGVFSFRVRCIFTNGTASNWATIDNVNLAALSTIPLDVTNLHQRSVDGQTVLDWTIVEDRRLIYYQVRKGESWDTGLVVGDVITQPPWAPVGDGTYFIRAYVLSPFGDRTYSENDASIDLEDSVISRNIILEFDEQAASFPGLSDGGIIISGPFLQTDPAGSITDPNATAVVEDLQLEGVKIAIYLSGHIIDIGRSAECRFWTEFEGVGTLEGADFLATDDFLAQTDVLGSSPTRLVRVFPIWRFAIDGDSDIFAPTDVFAEVDIFTSGVEFGPWTKVAQGDRKARYWQPGIVAITDDATVNASVTKFSWFVDVPDRVDDYTNLSVPNTGLDLVFYPGGYDSTPGGGDPALPFKGGLNGATVPHVQRAIIDATSGDEVEITNLTLSGCTVTVKNGGVAQTRDGVNLLVRGYGYA